MSKAGSASVFCYVDGYDFLASLVDSLTHEIESLTEPTWGLGSTAEAHAPVGVSRITLQQSGWFFDTAAGQSHPAMATHLPTSPTATARVASCGFAGTGFGAMFYGMEGDFTNAYQVIAAKAGLTKGNARHVISGQLDRGVVVQELATKTIDWNTKTDGNSVDYTTDTQQRVIPITSNSIANPTVVTCPVPHGLASNDIILISGVATSDPTINGQQTVTVIDSTTFSVPVNVTTGGTGGSFVRANSSGGGVGYLHVTAASGFTNFVGKIRDSADDTTYADLIEFADNVSAPFAERATVAGTVDRYLCFDGNVTGTGSITVFCGFARS